MTNINDDLEMHYYTKILDFYQSQHYDKETVEIWKSKSYIELMQVLKRTNNRNLVKNAIILILSLFEEAPLDIYDSSGLSVRELKQEDRKSYISHLKTEFNEIPH
ncbi:MAG: hypothetical protein KGD73_04150 [Candidatus Lokiarchaeota archaeon]|nr:hypothetical protein [Candidatus Lokiarchaeota archaeon]